MRVKVLLVFCVVILSAVAAFSQDKNHEFKYITLDQVSRYREDRVAFQHVDVFENPSVDNSLECLLIIRDSKMTLLMDGYDNPSVVYENRLVNDMERRLYDEESMWENRLNGKPDALQVTDRRVDLLKNFDEQFVSEKFGDYYKSIRDKFVQKHADTFRALMSNRKDSGLVVVHDVLPRPFYLNAPENPEKKYFTSATGKTSDGRRYYCEDSDGDGVTETFTVSLADGFNWGYHSGPNIIFIYQNKGDDLKGIIGSLAEEALNGTATEKQKIEENIPSQKDELMEWIENDLIKQERFYD